MKNNLITITLLGLLGILTSQLTTAQAQTTAFTYQGRLNDGAGPANGSYDLSFALYDAAGAGGQLGGSITNTATAVSNGLFTVTLDFGNQFPGADRWLEIGVRTNGGGAFSTLTPRQSITATPYAVQAANATVAASASSVAAANISGTIPLAQLPTEAVTNGASGVNFSGVFGGDGAGLTNVWHTGGNAGTIPGTHFLGTSDNQPLQFRVNNQLGLRLEYPTTGTVPNLVGGFGGNRVGAGSEGVVIAGGGRLGFTNSVGLDSDSSVIGGGYYNRIADNARSATINGGEYNTIGLNSIKSTIGGGGGNDIGNGSPNSTVAGGESNDIYDSAPHGAIGGGYNNTIGGDSSYVAISGGNGNYIGYNSDAGAIGGGWGNNIASGTGRSTIAGGFFNSIGTGSDYSSIGGGRENQIANNATYATIPGGGYNVATNYAFAAGYRAEARHTGAFVWADSTETNFTSTASNQFNVRASGGVRLETSGTGTALDGKQVPVGEEKLRIVRGRVSSTGSWLGGSGFTASRDSQGIYTINFSSAFSDIPSITVTPTDEVLNNVVTLRGVTNSTFKIVSYVPTVGLRDAGFHFIAVGPR